MKLKNASLFLAIAFFLAFRVAGQETTSDARAKHVIYGEILGTGGTFLSANYDRVHREYAHWYTDMTLGFGFFPGIPSWGAKGMFSVPFTYNLTFGQKSHHLECGLGLSFNSGIITTYSHDYSSVGPNQQTSTTVTADTHPSIWVTGRAGYKYQKTDGGFFFRAGFTPTFAVFSFTTFASERFLPLAGLGAGWCLRK